MAWSTVRSRVVHGLSARGAVYRVNTAVYSEAPRSLVVRARYHIYLEKSGMTASRFKVNQPGEDWVNSFLPRHNPTQRTATNIKLASAELSRQMFADYVDNI